MSVNGMFGPVDIAVSGLRAQGKQMAVISSNIANARTTDAGNGQPYRRMEAQFKTKERKGISEVSIEDVLTDKTPFERIYDPGNPRADGEGYVSMPNVKIATEMMNLTIATRAYQANVASLKRYEKMVDTTLELLR